MAEETFQLLSGSIRVEGGVAALSRGDAVPAGADPEDLERLRRIGAFGTGTPSAPAPAKALSADPSDAELAAFVADATVDEVLGAAESNEGLAERLLEAELAARDKPRKGIVEPLEALLEGEPEDGQGDQ